jgi:osmotically-inducible protein OsmY
MLDTEIARNVLDELLWDKSINADKINATASDGRVTLTGAVVTYHDKWRAGEDARGVHGVTAVDNDILVDITAERNLDADLVDAAEKGLAANTLVPPGAVKVTAEDGWLTMAGNVEHHYQRHAADFVVRHLPSLRGYTDRLTVSQDPATDTAKRITESLTRNAAVDARKIEVSDDAGAVTLSGTVRSYAEMKEAERSAWGSPGVTTVDDRLVITG